MTDTINVGIIGLGGMGRLHHSCYTANPHARIVALCDVDPQKARGIWGDLALNIRSEESQTTSQEGVAAYTEYADLIADPNVQAVDICLPTHLHAEVAIAALKAGKDVLCEKPLALNTAECSAVEQVVHETGRRLMVGHCLRYWPQYLAAEEEIRSGKHGDWLYARFHRSSGAPTWSWENWLLTGSRSGGVVLDMHVHDADTALWWFGAPQNIVASGIQSDDLPLVVDATWEYGAKRVNLHGSWDMNGGDFRYAFQVVMERGTISFDSAHGKSSLILHSGAQQTEIPITDASAYQAEIDDFIDAIRTDRPITRVTPASSRLAVAVAREEIQQIQTHVK
jgi:predicted dehydrogenase